MMGGEYGGVGILLPKLFKVFVAKCSCCLFDALVMLKSVITGVELGNMDGYGVGMGKLSNKGLVAVAFDRTNVKIAMGYGKREPSGMHEMGEYH